MPARCRPATTPIGAMQSGAWIRAGTWSATQAASTPSTAVTRCTAVPSRGSAASRGACPTTNLGRGSPIYQGTVMVANAEAAPTRPSMELTAWVRAI